VHARDVWALARSSAQFMGGFKPKGRDPFRSCFLQSKLLSYVSYAPRRQTFCRISSDSPASESGLQFPHSVCAGYEPGGIVTDSSHLFASTSFFSYSSSRQVS
jgi:hypothetical protein